MISTQCCKTAVALLALVTANGALAATMSKADYTAAKARNGANYKADVAACGKAEGSALDICRAQASGKDKVAIADLEYRYSGKTEDASALAVARADSTLGVATARCDANVGNIKDVCVAEAEAAHTKALADINLNAKVGEAKSDATREKLDADYKVAAEKCDRLAGDAKAACISAAKARFNQD